MDFNVVLHSFDVENFVPIYLADTNNTWPEDLFLYLSLNQSTTL